MFDECTQLYADLQGPRRDERFVNSRRKRSGHGLPLVVGVLAVFDCDLQEGPCSGGRYVFVGVVRGLRAEGIVAPLRSTGRHYAIPAALAA